MNDTEIKAWQLECQATELIKKMEKRGFTARYAPTAEEARKAVLELVPETGVVALLGSQTMNQLGVYAHFRESGRELVDHAMKTKGLGDKEAHDCQQPGSICNYFTIIDRSRPVGRINVVLVGEDLGY